MLPSAVPVKNIGCFKHIKVFLGNHYCTLAHSAFEWNSLPEAALTAEWLFAIFEDKACSTSCEIAFSSFIISLSDLCGGIKFSF